MLNLKFQTPGEGWKRKGWREEVKEFLRFDNTFNGVDLVIMIIILAVFGAQALA